MDTIPFLHNQPLPQSLPPLLTSVTSQCCRNTTLKMHSEHQKHYIFTLTNHLSTVKLLKHCTPLTIPMMYRTADNPSNICILLFSFSLLSWPFFLILILSLHLFISYFFLISFFSTIFVLFFYFLVSFACFILFCFPLNYHSLVTPLPSNLAHHLLPCPCLTPTQSSSWLGCLPIAVSIVALHLVLVLKVNVIQFQCKQFYFVYNVLKKILQFFISVYFI